MESKSKSIWTSKLIEFEGLISIASKYSLENFQKPENLNLKVKLEEILKNETRSVILDLGCGIGESSYKIANENPESLILAIDKSISRLERKNHFKKILPENLIFIHCDILDFYPVFYSLSLEKKLIVSKQYFLYPNPWAKIKSVKKRFHASPILPFIISLNSPVEFRSNWKRYLEEFQFVSEQLFQRKSSLETINVKDKWMTPFEKKYDLSGQEIYRLEVFK